jgi:hypothetical protein
MFFKYTRYWIIRCNNRQKYKKSNRPSRKNNTCTLDFKENKIKITPKIEFLTATDEKFRPQPPWETPRILLNELQIVEPMVNNATNIRNSICKYGIFKTKPSHLSIWSSKNLPISTKMQVRLYWPYEPQ